METNAGRTIRLLDGRGHVRLVEWMGTDLSIVRNARNSYDAAWRAGEDEGSDTRLIRYLYHNQHSTPFESVVFTFDVKAPIFVFRQWHRHRTWSYNEISARYKELGEDFYVPLPQDVGTQNKKNHQARDIAEGVEVSSEEYERGAQVGNAMFLSNSLAFDSYRAMLQTGVPRELARTVLPVATFSSMFATVNLHNLFRFLTLRDDPHAQMEIQVYARAMLELIEPIVPVAVAAYKVAKKEREDFAAWKAARGKEASAE